MAENELARIGALSDRLAPLGLKARGMRIEATEWNALVETLRGILEVDRLQEQSARGTLEQQFARTEHEHLGEVRLDWLDPALQATIAGRGDGSGGGAVATRTALADMSRKVDDLGAAVARLTERVESLQKQLDRSSVLELDRDRTIRLFNDRFSAVDNLRTLVTDSVNDINGVKRGLDQVLDLRRTLTDPAGQPIDVAGLRDQVRGLELLRENMLGADGKPLRLRDVELKIKDIEDVVGVRGGGGLDARLGELSAGLETKLDAKTKQRVDALAVDLRDEQARGNVRIGADVNAAIEAAKASIPGTVDQRVAALDETITRRIDERTKAARDGVKQELTQALTGQIDTKLADLPRQVQRSVDAARVASEAALTERLAAQVTVDVQAKTTAVEIRLNDRLRETTGTVRAETRAQIDAAAVQVHGEVSVMIDAAATKSAASLAGQTQLLRNEINAARADAITVAFERSKSLLEGVRGDVLRTVDDKLAGSAASLQRTLDARIADLRRERLITPDRLERDVRLEPGRGGIVGPG